MLKYSWYKTWLIGLVSRELTNCQGDLGSIQAWVIPKTLKIVLDTSLLNTQQYKVCINGKAEQSREKSSALPRCSSYWKGSLLGALDSCRRLTIPCTRTVVVLLITENILFSEGISPKVSVVEWLEFERASFIVADHHLCHYVTGTLYNIIFSKLRPYNCLKFTKTYNPVQIIRIKKCSSKLYLFTDYYHY